MQGIRPAPRTCLPAVLDVVALLQAICLSLCSFDEQILGFELKDHKDSGIYCNCLLHLHSDLLDDACQLQ
jgi:hypothetical protein